MGLFSSLGRGLGKSFQVKKWVDYDHLKGNASLIRSLYCSITKTNIGAEQQPHSDFAAAKNNFNLSDADVARLAKRFKLFSYVFLAGTVCVLTYALALMLTGHALSSISAFIIAALAACFTFRESYNYYLITTQQLRSTPAQWLKFILKRG